jgi:hypothetical protein
MRLATKEAAIESIKYISYYLIGFILITSAGGIMPGVYRKKAPLGVPKKGKGVRLIFITCCMT